MRLAGNIACPEGAGPYPGVVLIGGSGASDRHNDGLFDALREHLVIAGLAVMTYDKRGTGESTGAWAGATVDQLATDASAALGTLAEQDDVTTDRVSAFGHSEGGWVALRLCARTDSRLVWY